MDVSGIIFDLDGTLIDSMRCWGNADKKFLRENGITPPDGISDIMKKLSMREAAEYFINIGIKMQPEQITRRIEQIVYDEYSNVIPLKYYAKELLQQIDCLGIPYCVATANYRSLTDIILKRHGIYDKFRFIYTCEESGIKKDDPLFFSSIAKLLGTQIQNTIVIDDSLHCIEAAKQTGFITVAMFDEMTSNWEKTSKTADISVRDLSEFAQYFSDGSFQCDLH